MNDNTISLILYLESQAVYKHGFINEAELNNQDRSLIENWRVRGLLRIEPLQHPNQPKKPESVSSITDADPNQKSKIINQHSTYTHRIWLGERLWNMAHRARKEKAERTNPTLKDPKMEIHKNGSTDSISDADKSVKSPQSHKSVIHLDINDFKTFVSDTGHHLQEQQERAAKHLFEAWNNNELAVWTRARSTGTSWLLRAIDNYLTALNKLGEEK